MNSRDEAAAVGSEIGTGQRFEGKFDMIMAGENFDAETEYLPVE